MHPDRAAIERDVRERPSRTAARLHGLNPGTVLKHARWLKAEDERRENMSPVERLVEGLDRARQRLESSLEWVEQHANNPSAYGDKRVLALIREMRQTVKAVAEVKGMIRQPARTEVSVGVSVQVLSAMKVRLLAALEPFPDARQAAARALLEADGE